jgi:hypothetical protein
LFSLAGPSNQILSAAVAPSVFALQLHVNTNNNVLTRRATFQLRQGATLLVPGNGATCQYDGLVALLVAFRLSRLLPFCFFCHSLFFSFLFSFLFFISCLLPCGSLTSRYWSGLYEPDAFRDPQATFAQKSGPWIEIYNNDTAPVDLKGWSLSDDVNFPQKYVCVREGIVVFVMGYDYCDGL